MATQLETVNKVLRRLREDSVSTVNSSEYSVLIADFVNDIIEDLQIDYDWPQLETDITVSVLADTTTYDLTGKANNRSILKTDMRNQPLMFVFDDGSDEQGRQMRMIPSGEMFRLTKGDEGQSNLEPNVFSLRPQATADGIELTIWPKPEVTRTIKGRFWQPMNALDVEGPDDGTIIYLPELPIFRGTMYLALNERGEEMGEPGGVAEKRYIAAKAEAIYADMIYRQRNDEYEGYRD